MRGRPAAGSESAAGKHPRRRWTFAGCVLDEGSLELTVAGAIVEVDPKPLEVLLHLLRHAGEVVTKDELAEAVWPGRIITDSNLTKTVAVLRAALGEAGQAAIKTVHGYGYRLVAPVSVQASAPDSAPARFDFAPGQCPPLRPHWRLVERLGTGGRGEVWLARHDGTGARRVFKFADAGGSLAALKREITLNRFLRETLPDRDDYLRLLDWNVEEPPFFVEAEHLPCGNFASWADAQGGLAALPLELRLELMAQIAEAVAATHAVGVLHKDLKPANVLIVERDGAWRIRLADFGSAGMLDPSAIGALGITQMGFTVDVEGEASATPLYLAPEALAGQPFTVQSDIYALGVMLYQLVAGDFRKPLAPGWEKDIDAELLREDIAAAAAGKPADRMGDAAQLAQGLRSLGARGAQRAAEREAREQLRLANAAAEQARIQQQRQRVMRYWMSALVLVLGAGVAAATGLYLQAREAQLTAEALNAFLNDSVLGNADPRRGPARSLTIAKLLDRAAADIPAQLGGNPRVAARIHETLGTNYHHLGIPSSAIEHLSRAAAFYRELYGDASQASVKVHQTLVPALLNSGQHRKGCELAEWLLGAFGENADPHSADFLRARSSRAMCARFRGQSRQAANDYREILGVLERSPPADLRLLEGVLSGLAISLYEAGENPEAVQVIDRLLEHCIRMYGEHHFTTAQNRLRRGYIYHAAGRSGEALQEALQGYRDQQTWLDPDAPGYLAFEPLLADLYVEQGRFAEAETFARLYLEGPQRDERRGTAFELSVRRVVAEVRERNNRCAEALRLVSDGLAVQEASTFPEHWYAGALRALRAVCLVKQGQASQARQELDYLAGVLERERVDGTLHINKGLIASLWRARGLVLLSDGSRQEAREALRKAHAAMRDAHGAENWRTQRVKRELAAAGG